jgi:hypothetical protein
MKVGKMIGRNFLIELLERNLLMLGSKFTLWNLMIVFMISFYWKISLLIGMLLQLKKFVLWDLPILERSVLFLAKLHN